MGVPAGGNSHPTCNAPDRQMCLEESPDFAEGLLGLWREGDEKLRVTLPFKNTCSTASTPGEAFGGPGLCRSQRKSRSGRENRRWEAAEIAKNRWQQGSRRSCPAA